MRGADSGGVGRAGGHAEAEGRGDPESAGAERDVDRDELLAEWREVAQQHGFTAERVSELRADVKADDRDETTELRAAVAEALKEITSSQSSFTLRKLVEQTAIQAQTHSFPRIRSDSRCGPR